MFSRFVETNQMCHGHRAAPNTKNFNDRQAKA